MKVCPVTPLFIYIVNRERLVGYEMESEVPHGAVFEKMVLDLGIALGYILQLVPVVFGDLHTVNYSGTKIECLWNVAGVKSHSLWETAA